jgi:hypothetical protein
LTQQGWIGCANWLVTLEDGDGFSKSFVSCFSFPLHFQISSCSTLLQFLNLRVAGDSPAQLPKSVYCLKNFIQKRTEGLNSRRIVNARNRGQQNKGNLQNRGQNLNDQSDH